MSSSGKKHSVSYPRLSRLASTRDNLRVRVANCLGKTESTLCLKSPPRDMCDSKLNCIRVMKSWLFNDGVVKLRQSNLDVKDGSYIVQVKGDKIQESHLNQIFEKDRHSFTLGGQGYTIYNGKFKPVEIDGEIPALKPLEFEERLLSFSMDKSCSVIVCKIASIIHVYISGGQQKSVMRLLGSSFTLEGTVNCGDQNRSSNQADVDISFAKYSSVTKLKRAKQELKNLRESLRQYSSALKENVFIIDIAKGDGGPFNIYSFLSSKSFEVRKLDLVKLLRTPDATLQKSNNSSSRQVVIFSEEQIDATVSPYITQNLPEEARILHAIASGRYNNTVIRFQHEVDNQLEEDAAYLEVNLGSKTIRNKWIWTETNEPALLDFDSIPATTAPQCYDMYACCGNILELKGGRVRAEGMTILPGGDAFLSLSRRCFGIDTSGDTSTISNKQTIAADIFCDFFTENIAEEGLEYSPQAVDLLCDAFNSLNGLEMNPWDEEDITDVRRGNLGYPVRAVRDSGNGQKSNLDRNQEINNKIFPGQRGSIVREQLSPSTKISSNDLSINNQEEIFALKDFGAAICQELGSNNVPSSFMTLFQNMTLFENSDAEATNHNDTKKPETVNPTSKHKAKKMFRCPKCDLHDVNPLSLKKLEKHLCVSHLGFDLEQQKKPHSCVDCDKKQTPQSVWPHFIAAHTDFKLQPSLFVKA